MDSGCLSGKGKKKLCCGAPAQRKGTERASKRALYLHFFFKHEGTEEDTSLCGEQKRRNTLADIKPSANHRRFIFLLGLVLICLLLYVDIFF